MISTTTNQSTKSIPISEPEPFDGGNYPVHIFLSKLKLFFRANPSSYDTQEAKSLYLISRLQGTAYEWALPIIETEDGIINNFDGLALALKVTFEDRNREAKAEAELFLLTQGSDSVQTYTTRFNNLAREVEWNEPALVAVFRRGLHPRIKDVLANLDRPRTVGEMSLLASQIEQRQIERDGEKRVEGRTFIPRRPFNQPESTTPTSMPAPATNPDGINVNELWSALPERQRRYMTRAHLGQCTYCGDSDHKRDVCSKPNPNTSGKGKAQSQH